MPSKHSLLIVEDDEDLLETYERWFVRRGYDVSAAHHPRRAIELAQQQAFRVAVVDYRLPEMTGCELMRQLKPLSDIAVIILSGCDDLTAEQEATQGGAFAYLVKPCPLDDLAEIVEGAIEERISNPRGTIKDG